MLKQWEGLLAPEASEADATGQNFWDAISSQASQFMADYAEWSAGGRQGLDQTAADLLSLRIELGGEWDRLRAAGDQAGAQAMAETVMQVDEAQAAVRSAQEQADQWGGTWDTLASWLSAMGSAVGLGILFIPIALSAAAAIAAIAALAYVLRTWKDNSDRASFLRDLTTRVAEGSLTESQAVTLAHSYTPPSESLLGGFFGGLGTAGLVVAGVVGYLLLRR